MFVDFSTLSPRASYKYLAKAVAPRPICLAATVAADGTPNLSPYSFFNIVSGAPPVLVFAPLFGGRDKQPKDTLNNVMEVPEVVVNIVNHALVEQMSLTSTAYPPGVDEFVKAGLEALPSRKVRPPRVALAPVAFECEVTRVIPLGDGPMAGSLVLARVLCAHIRDEYLTEGALDPTLLDLVGRMGGDDYVRATGAALFSIPKPLKTLGVGVDALPAAVRNSTILTGNDLGRLGNVTELPTPALARRLVTEAGLAPQISSDPVARHRLAARLLREGQTETALAVLLSPTA